MSEDSERDEATASDVLGVAMRTGRLYFYPLPEPNEQWFVDAACVCIAQARELYGEPPASEVTHTSYARVLPKPSE